MKYAKDNSRYVTGEDISFTNFMLLILIISFSENTLYNRFRFMLR